MANETSEKKKTALEKAYNLQEKTEIFKYDNESTLFDIKIAIAQGFDEDGTDEGMAAATGLVVIADELEPGESNTVNIGHLSCRATRAECSIIWRRRSNGKEGTLDHDDATSAPDDYLYGVRWWITDPPQLDEQAMDDPTPIIGFDFRLDG